MAALSVAQLLVSTIAFKRWSHTLGGTATEPASDLATADARKLAAHVEWAARLLPFSTKCLVRAMALSWILRRQGLAHTMVFAVRPADRRQHPDVLHAWVETNGERIIGDIPGPWIESLRLGSKI